MQQKKKRLVSQLNCSESCFDVVIIGGGINGAGVAQTLEKRTGIADTAKLKLEA